MPSGASISLNGRFVGTTPTTLSLYPGERQLTFELAGFEPVTYAVKIAEDSTTNTTVRFEENTGIVTMNIAPWGNVYLNGTLLAERIAGEETFEVSANEHTLSVVHPTYGRWERRIDLSSNESMNLSVDFREQVSVSVTAFDEYDGFVQGEIFVDGQTTNYYTPMTLDLPVGMHTIEVRAEGYATTQKTTTLAVNDEPMPTLKFILKSDNE